MSEKSSIEERLEKLEKSKSRDVQRQERAAELEKLKRTPIKYVADDPSRINKSYAQIVADKKAKKDEEAEFEKFKADKKVKKEAGDGVQKVEEKKEVLDKPAAKSKGRPKRVE
jgi:hypothetical protein